MQYRALLGYGLSAGFVIPKSRGACAGDLPKLTMFSSAPKQNTHLDDLIKKATDETLTSDNWQYILDVCDNILSNPEDATKDAIKSVSARLALKDANVILRTLSLLLALAENGGARMKQEIASKSCLNESIIKRLGDKRLHRTVKVRIVEVVKQLKDSFEDDPSLRPISDAYKLIKHDYPQYVQSSLSSGPVKPAKQERTKQQRQLEEDDLQRVLKLSLQEYEREQTIKKAYLNDKPLPSPSEQLGQQNLQEVNVAPKSNVHGESESTATQGPSTITKVRALYDLISYEEDELSFRKGDIINVIESVYRDWWRGSLLNGKTGIFPLNYVTPIVPKTQAQLEEESATERSLLTTDLRNVDRLLAYLSSSNNELDEDEITKLYNSVIPLRPVLGKVIDKYAIRKEELLALNNQLKTNVAYYNELMDNLIQVRAASQVPSNAYQRAPYPSHLTGQPNSPPQLQDPRYSERLLQQPTSSGFGNAESDPRFSNTYQRPAYDGNVYPQAQYVLPHPSGNARRISRGQLLNIESFPEVHNI